MPISSEDTLFLGTTTACLIDSWNTTYISSSYGLDGAHQETKTVEYKKVEYKKEEGYPLRASFSYFSAHLDNLYAPEVWKQFERTLLDWKEGVWPLSSEVERVDSHLLKDWRLLELRSKLIP